MYDVNKTTKMFLNEQDLKRHKYVRQCATLGHNYSNTILRCINMYHLSFYIFTILFFKHHCEYWVILYYLEMNTSLTFIIFIKNLSLNYITQEKK